jgi:hypothetical protein
MLLKFEIYFDAFVTEWKLFRKYKKCFDQIFCSIEKAVYKYISIDKWNAGLYLFLYLLINANYS